MSGKISAVNVSNEVKNDADWVTRASTWLVYGNGNQFVEILDPRHDAPFIIDWYCMVGLLYCFDLSTSSASAS